MTLVSRERRLLSKSPPNPVGPSARGPLPGGCFPCGASSHGGGGEVAGAGAVSLGGIKQQSRRRAPRSPHRAEAEDVAPTASSGHQAENSRKLPLQAGDVRVAAVGPAERPRQAGQAAGLLSAALRVRAWGSWAFSVSSSTRSTFEARRPRWLGPRGDFFSWSQGLLAPLSCLARGGGRRPEAGGQRAGGGGRRAAASCRAPPRRSRNGFLTSRVQTVDGVALEPPRRPPVVLGVTLLGRGDPPAVGGGQQPRPADWNPS